MNHTGTANSSILMDFILLGLAGLPVHPPFLFALFLITYMLTLLGNMIIILAVWVDSRLQTPMYYLLANFSFVDMSMASVTVPKMLADLLSLRKTISVSCCFVQMYFFLFVGNTESFLLAGMAYDRYIAICFPLHYTTVMTRRVCFALVTFSWAVSSLHSLLHTLMTTRLSFCGSSIITHFFCDLPTLLKMSCSDTSVNDTVLFIEASLLIMSPLACVLLSYIQIVLAILKIRTAHGRWRTFSTCASHLAVVSLFYGAGMCTFLQPSSTRSLYSNRLVSLMYTALTPMLNPFIYSLRNKEIKLALKRVLASH
ncbi:olfactory receptor 1E16-like [Ambystoma mexicanum]|uniref:olfactory receptor 1E16-like n=1 Tax=Ambystoma mexicanum TaxID=8296 RepID=UPI0037E74656